MTLLRRMQTRWPLRQRNTQMGNSSESAAVHSDQVDTAGAHVAVRYASRWAVRFLRGMGAALRDLGTARAGIVPLPRADDQQ
jgi:hypothetical protein